MRGSRVITAVLLLLAGGAASLLAAEAMMLWSTMVEGDSIRWPSPDEGNPVDRNPSIIARNAVVLARLAELKFAADRLAPDHFRGVTEYVAYLRTFVGRGVDAAVYTSVLPSDPWAYESRELVELRAGWPFRCLRARRIPSLPAPASPWLDAVPAPRWLSPEDSTLTGWIAGNWARRPLAFHPILPGLLGNAAAFGAGLGAVAIVMSTARRAFRRCRHRCPTCNYDRRGLVPDSPCPECGRA